MKNKSPIIVVSIVLASIFLAVSIGTAGVDLNESPTVLQIIDDDDGFPGDIDLNDDPIVVPPIDDDGFPGDIDQSDEQIIVPPIEDDDGFSGQIDQGGPATPITPVQLKCQFWVGEPYNMYVPGTMINGECVPDYLPVGASPVCSICPNAETEETHTLDFIQDSFFKLLFFNVGDIDLNDDPIVVPPIDDDGFPGDIDQNDEQIIVPPIINDNNDAAPDISGPAIPVPTVPIECDCGGCPGGPVLVDGVWRCICAPCIPEGEGQNIGEISGEMPHILDFLPYDFFKLLFN